MTLAVASVLTAAKLMARALEASSKRSTEGYDPSQPRVPAGSATGGPIVDALRKLRSARDEPSTARATEKFDPRQPRDSDGQWSDGIPGPGNLADKLKLGKRAPAGFTVRSSKKLKTDSADVGVAEVDGPGGPEFRVGIVDIESGKWDAGLAGQGRKAELRKQVAEKRALFDSDSDDVDDDIEDQISELESELEGLEGDRTAIVSPEQMADFRRQLDDALEVAKANKVEQDEVVKKFEAIDKKRDAIIDEHSDPDLERRVSKVSQRLRHAQKTVQSLEGDLKNGSPHGWSPERTAELLESWKADVAEYEADLAPLLARRAQIVPRDALARLEELDRQQAALNDVDITDVLATAEVSAPNGTRIRAEISGSDDEDEQWTTSRLYVLNPGETTDDADNSDSYGYFRGLRGLNKLISGFDTTNQTGGRSMEAFAVMSDSPAVRLMLWARTLEATDSFLRKGKRISVERGKGGKFAKKGVSDVIDAVADVVTTDKPAAPKARRSAVSRALASGDPNALDGMSRESLRREAKARGLDTPRGVSEDVLRDMLWDDERSSGGPGTAAPDTKPAEPFPDEHGYRAELLRTPRNERRRALADMMGGYGTPFEDANTKAEIVARGMGLDTSGLNRYKATGRPNQAEMLDLMVDSVNAQDDAGRAATGKARVPRERKSKLDGGGVVQAIAGIREAPRPGDDKRMADLLSGLSHKDLDAIAEGFGENVRGTREQKRKQLVDRVAYQLDMDAIMRGGMDRKPATQDEASSYFARMRNGHQAAMQADRDARDAATKRRQADEILDNLPADREGRRKAHTEVGKLTLDADRLDPAAARKSEIDAIIANPKPEDRDKLIGIFRGMKVADLKALAKEHNVTLTGNGKAEMATRLADGTIGFKLNSRAIRGGDWNGPSSLDRFSPGKA